MKISSAAGRRAFFALAGDQRRKGPAARFDGVRVESGRALGQSAPVLAARGEIAYSVAPMAQGAGAPPSDHRSNGRSRTRLRSAKIVNSVGVFLCECRIHDRSTGGLRLALARNIGLPGRICLYEDDTGQTNWVVVVWRRGAEVGVRYCAPGAPPPLRASDRFALRERYYAVPDR